MSEEMLSSLWSLFLKVHAWQRRKSTSLDKNPLTAEFMKEITALHMILSMREFQKNLSTPQSLTTRQNARWDSSPLVLLETKTTGDLTW